MTTEDQLFKNLVGDYAREALQFFAKSEADSIPANATITPVKQQLLKDRMPDRFFELDIAVEIRFPGKRREAIVFCVEENTRTGNLRKHAIYALMLSEILKTKRVVPVAIHPRGKTRVPETFELKGDHGTYLQFKVLTTTLSQLTASDYKDSNNRVELICMPRMKYAKEEKLDIVESCVQGFFKHEPDVDLRIKYSQLIAFQMELTAAEEKRLRKRAERTKEMEAYMSYGEELVARGIAQGKAEGKAEGKVEGKAEGIIEAVIALCRRGLLSAEKAREQLKELANLGTIPKVKLREALKLLPK